MTDQTPWLRLLEFEPCAHRPARGPGDARRSAAAEVMAGTGVVSRALFPRLTASGSGSGSGGATGTGASSASTISADANTNGMRRHRAAVQAALARKAC